MRLSLILLSLQLWGNVEVSSSETTCSVLPDVPHAHISEETKKVEYQGGHVIHFTCEPGYFTSVSTIRYVCSSEGWLAVQKETCYSSGCPPPPAEGGVIVKGLPETDLILPGHLITFTCDGAGKYLNGSSVLKCGEDEQWDNPFPSCGAPLGCGKPPSLEDGDTKETLWFQYRHGERVEYICQRLYIMEGEPYKTCFNGEWIGQIRCLKPCTVDGEAMSTHNIGFKYSYYDKLYLAHNDAVQFRCTGQRRPIDGLSMRQRCVDGVVNLPTCH